MALHVAWGSRKPFPATPLPLILKRRCWRSAELRLPLQCRVAKFNGVHTLTLHIPENFGADHTTLTFIGIKGDLTEVSLPLRPLPSSREPGAPWESACLLLLAGRGFLPGISHLGSHSCLLWAASSSGVGLPTWPLLPRLPALEWKQQDWSLTGVPRGQLQVLAEAASVLQLGKRLETAARPCQCK